MNSRFDRGKSLEMEAKAVILLSLVFGGTIFQILADTGFLSIDCGSNFPNVDSRNISWIPDSDFVNTGVSIKLNTSAPPAYDTLDTLRVFPGHHRKSCYVLPTYRGSRNLVRTSFRYGNYDGQNNPPMFSLAIDVTTVAFINTSGNSPAVYETIATAKDENLSVCLFSQDSSHTPFISALELRQIPRRMYAVEDMQYFNRIFRINFGAKSVEYVRFPDDPYDRFWDSDLKLFKGALRNTIRTSQEIEQSHLLEGPPSVVLQTASIPSTSIMVPVTSMGYGESFRVYLYFAEVENQDDQMLRSFDVIVNDVYVHRNLTLFSSGRLSRGVEISTVTPKSKVINVTLAPHPHSNLGPIINALEIYSVISASVPTLETDVHAVISLRKSFQLEQFSGGDPCEPVPWEWLSCTAENPRRIFSVKLSARNLNGSLPLSILALSELTELHLDHNQMTGSIPDLSSLKKLKSLHLEYNKLNGSLPTTLGDMLDLGELILDDNHLSGQIPMSLYTKSNIKISLAGNPEMSLPGCMTGKIPCPQAENTNDSSLSKGRPPVVLITVVSGVGATVCLIGTGAFVFFLSKKKQLKFPHPLRKRLYTISDIQVAREEADPTSVQSGGKTWGRSGRGGALELAAEAREFTSLEVKKATRNFTRKVGEGTCGPVFHGKLSGGLEIAVRIHGCHRTQDFENGVQILSRVCHQNLVSMIGCSHDSENSFLIYEFLHRGSLSNNLNDPEACKLLTWKLRLNIALQAAKGLLHLHTELNPPIIHRNMKSGNVLLTKKFSAKVADFGHSNLVPEGETDYVSILVKGATSGYLDPEFYSKQKFTEKSDVYSFGVVLLEIISGRRPVNLQLSRISCSLTDWVYFRKLRKITDGVPWMANVVWLPRHVQARNQLELGNVGAIVDPSLDKLYNIASMWKVADIAMYSVEPESKHRPTMTEVVKELEDALFLEEQGKQSAVPFCPSFSISDKADSSHLEPVYKKFPNRKF